MRPLAGLALAFALGTLLETAHAVRSGVCSLVPPPTSVSRANIFSAEQEQWLGNAQAEMVEPRYMLQPEAESAYIDEIGQKLASQLPDPKIRYEFRVFESGDVRAFSLAGGHIYISRKLLLDARSEDEVAAMLAQEIGRVYTHHAASLVTLRLSKMMGVKSVGDKFDLIDKFERLQNITIPDSAQLSDDDQKKDELLADRVALYVLIKAGYAPQALAAFLDRINLNNGYTGNFFTDLLDTTPAVSERIKQAHKVVEELPEPCRIVRPPYRAQFKPYEDALSVARIDPIVAPTPGLQSVALDQPMNPALENVRLSGNGKYALAQDESQIHVLSTAPLARLFSIDALGSEIAQFTPNSQNIVFHYNTLRVENWDIATRQPVGVLDFPDYMGCSQSSLSPDGNTFACITHVDNAVWLRLIDLTGNRLIYQNTNIFEPNMFDWNSATGSVDGRSWSEMRWTQDGRYFLATSGAGRVVFDLVAQKAIKPRGSAADLYEGGLAFVDSSKLLFECDWGAHGLPMWTQFKMCYATFPDGKLIRNFTLDSGWLSGITRGPLVLTGPSSGAAASLFDPATGSAQGSFKLETVDVSGDMVAREMNTGGLAVGKLGGPWESIALPVTPLLSIEAGAFSADGRYLAVSDRARSAVWDLAAGKRVTVAYPFRAVAFDDNDHLQAQYVDQELKPAANRTIDQKTHKTFTDIEIGNSAVQYGSVEIGMKVHDATGSTPADVDVEGRDALSGNRLWLHRFAFGVPRFLPADDSQLLLAMSWLSDAANDEWRHNKNVFLRSADEINKYDDDGLLTEVLDSRTGTAKRLLLVPEMRSARGDLPTAAVFGDLLAVRGGRNNTVVYRVSDGARVLAFFGRALAADAGLGLFAAANRPQELVIYDLASGKRIESLTLDQSILVARFIKEKRQLLVLTASQHVYAIDLPAPPAR
jgi:Zn-dependent protease with chaperone function